MLKAIAILGATISMLTVPQTMPKKVEKPPQRSNEKTVFIGILQTDNAVDPNYVIEGNELTRHDKLNSNVPQQNYQDQNSPNQDNQNNTLNDQNNQTRVPQNQSDYNKEPHERNNPRYKRQSNSRNERRYRQNPHSNNYDQNDPVYDQNQSQNRLNTMDLRTLDDMQISPDEHYNTLKSKLDERFAYMFELKASLERQQSEASAKWEEYFIMRQAYERQLKRIIADWVMNSSF